MSGLTSGTPAPHTPATRHKAVSRVARTLPVPAGAGLARVLVERNIMSFRHGWVAIVTGFVEPVFYLLALGIGLGRLIRTVTTDGGQQVPYAVFVAPALLASSAMNGAFFAAAFLIVAWFAGVVTTPWALLALPIAVLIAFALAAMGMFLTTYMRSWVDVDYVTLAIEPMFLFSATFFPLSTYPPVAQWLVQATRSTTESSSSGRSCAARCRVACSGTWPISWSSASSGWSAPRGGSSGCS